MGMWDRFRSWLATEQRELGEVGRDLEQRLDRDLSERERRLNETPSEAMERLQAEMSANDDAFADLEAKIGGTGARADAEAELLEAADDTDDTANDDTGA